MPQSKPFDTTGKHLIEHYPQAWLAWLGAAPGTPVTVIDADLATVLAEVDKVLLLGGDDPWLGHLELQSGYEVDLGERVLAYNVVLGRRHHLPVRSVVVLLRPGADGPAITGEVRHVLPDGDCNLVFRYHVVRIWEVPAEELLAGALGTLPLAPISAVAPEELPSVIRRMDERISREASRPEAATLWMAAFILLGLRYPGEFAAELLKGIGAMKESTTYQAILEEGREEGRLAEARAILLRLGRRQFGEPAEEIVAAVEAVGDPERLERMAERVLEASGWEELVAEPS